MKKELKDRKKIEEFKKSSKKKEQKNKRRTNYSWIIRITLLSLVISLTLGFVSETLIPNVNILIGILLVVIFIGIGVLFDMIGVAVTSSDVKPFHSMSSQKVRGAKVAVKLHKNADKVSSFCNDVVGDICGIVSGSAGVIIASTLSKMLNSDLLLTSLLTTSIIAALTIGSKALGKGIAINKSNIIMYEFAKTISYFYTPKK